MATVEKVADSLESLSMNSQPKTKKVTEPVKKDFESDNGSYMYPQTYGYVPHGAYSMPSSPLPPMGLDGHLHALQEYYYPSAYYQAPLQTSRTKSSQRDISTSGVSDQASLSNKTNTGNLSAIASGGVLSGNNGSESLKSTSKGSSLNPNASYNRVGHRDSTFSYDGVQPTPWLDMSISSNGKSKYTNFHNERPSSGAAQAFGYLNHVYPNNMADCHYGDTIRRGSGFGSYGYYTWKRGQGCYNVGNNNKYKDHGYGKENMDGLNELNKGPRVKGCKTKDGTKLAVEDLNIPLTESNKENSVSLVPDMEQYNKEDFPESYSNAKFFVIKSYSEDDVHKSVKYNVWASTSNGNKKLDAAFREAKEKSDACPVFLLFSVNTSGQFVGLAEMVGQVDFNKTVEYWQQDKWTGCFPVKWHIIKDVPNMALRHITLENNESKPVTNSRDTQEVYFEQGVQILKIFKDHSSKTCILDDFEFYEARQKTIQEKKAKHQQFQKKILRGEPNDSVVIDKENVTIENNTLEKPVGEALLKEPTVVSTEVLKANGDVKPMEENGSVTAIEGCPKSVSVASVC
ncbi:YTH domain-containing protein ECT3-like [Hibiscus syriacus]|uniref:YTH domain-containing protein ECT3-like n=1 Tax=Hibiscus syriacus TaxID=106335 RepID=UPI001920F62E|nr:YTH domain-containing protein ECT3-like [Hibiscus syriacus]